MRASVLAALALLAGCGDADDQDIEGASTEQIRRVSTPTNTMAADKAGSVALQPLTLADLERERIGAGCRFARNGQLLVAASGGNALARVGGSLRHFVQTAPVDSTGTFLEDRQISISIGREGPDGDAATIRITNRRTEAELRWAGSWRCDG